MQLIIKSIHRYHTVVRFGKYSNIKPKRRNRVFKEKNLLSVKLISRTIEQCFFCSSFCPINNRRNKRVWGFLIDGLWLNSYRFGCFIYKILIFSILPHHQDKDFKIKRFFKVLSLCLSHLNKTIAKISRKTNLFFSNKITNYQQLFLFKKMNLW